MSHVSNHVCWSPLASVVTCIFDSPMTFFTKSLATEAAIETLWSPPIIMALIPMTSPLALTSGPPELPGARGIRANDGQFIAASILGGDQRTDNPTRNRIALSPRMAEGKDHFTDARRNGGRLEGSQMRGVDGE